MASEKPNSHGHEGQDNSIVESDSASPYSVFLPLEKWWITSLVAYAALFSTLSSFIYYPAIPSISRSLAVSVDQVNWTVTSYMAIATIAPMLVGDAADSSGRRPVYIVALSLYIATNIAIAAVENYPALLGLRILQALAISGTFSIAYGVIADISPPSKRGSYVSVVSFAITIAPTFGPIIGGSLTYTAGWTWIFWFLAMASGLCLLMMILFLPETARNIVDNGSVPPPRPLRLPLPSAILVPWKRSSLESEESNDTPRQRKLRVPNPLKSLTILTRKDNLIIICACSLLYVVYTCVNTSLAIIFVDVYHLTQWQAGLIYLPFGVGGILSTFFSGPLINTAYEQARIRQGLSSNHINGDDLDIFPVERARIRVIWLPLSITSASVLAFGWLLHYQQHIAAPLSMQFVAGLCMQLDFSIYNTLLVDKNHRNPAAAQASSNVVRCGLAAIVVAFLQQILDKLGTGWTFTLMSGFCLIALGLFAFDYCFGTRWRQAALATSRVK